MARSHKRVRKIAEAVFRGKKTQYKFDVFPLSSDITDAPAVFIISRRVTDKFRKWHHSAICLGETHSICAEIKKHKRAKCVKQNAANVICILKDADETNRSVVVDDLQTARSFSCIRNADQPNIKAKSNVKTSKSAPVAATVSERAKANNASAKPANAKPVKLSKPAKAKAAKPAVAPAKASKPVAAPPRKAKKSQPARAAAPKPAKKKPSKTAVAKTAKPKSARAVTAKRSAAKRTVSAAKPRQSAAPTKRKSAAKKSAAASPKRRTRVQGGVDSKRGQHRLSKPKKPVDRRAKSGAAGRSGPGKKAAA